MAEQDPDPSDVPDRIWYLEREGIEEVKYVLNNVMDKIRIGRSDRWNDKICKESHVSQKHLELIRQGSPQDWRTIQWSVTNLSQTNGTFLNCVRMDGSRILKHNDLLGLGNPKPQSITVTKIVKGENIQEQTFVYRVKAPTALTNEEGFHNFNGPDIPVEIDTDTEPVGDPRSPDSSSPLIPQASPGTAQQIPVEDELPEDPPVEQEHCDENERENSDNESREDEGSISDSGRESAKDSDGESQKEGESDSDLRVADNTIKSEDEPMESDEITDSGRVKALSADSDGEDQNEWKVTCDLGVAGHTKMSCDDPMDNDEITDSGRVEALSPDSDSESLKEGRGDYDLGVANSTNKSDNDPMEEITDSSRVEPLSPDTDGEEQKEGEMVTPTDEITDSPSLDTLPADSDDCDLGVADNTKKSMEKTMENKEITDLGPLNSTDFDGESQKEGENKTEADNSDHRDIAEDNKNQNIQSNWGDSFKNINDKNFDNESYKRQSTITKTGWVIKSQKEGKSDSDSGEADYQNIQSKGEYVLKNLTVENDEKDRHKPHASSTISHTPIPPLNVSKILENKKKKKKKRLYAKPPIQDASPRNFSWATNKQKIGQSLLEAGFKAAPVSAFLHVPLADSFNDLVNMEVNLNNKKAKIIDIKGYMVKLLLESAGKHEDAYKWINIMSPEISGLSDFENLASPVRKKSKFREGDEVEVIDRAKLGQTKVAKVKSNTGGRLHLEYNQIKPGEINEFWTHEDSQLVHKKGWSVAHGHFIDASSKYKDDTSEKSKIIREGLKPTEGFEEGMKLEVVDPFAPGIICVATVKKVLRGGFIYVMVDGSKESENPKREKYEQRTNWFCYPTNSPHIFPINFCGKHNIVLDEPVGHKGKFDWKKYNESQKSKGVPQDSFADRNLDETQFEVDMKVECADLIEPNLICPATITQIEDKRLLRIHFDGYPDDEFDQWMDCTSRDLYPVGWSELMGHSLQEPLGWVEATKEEVKKCEEKKRKMEKETSGKKSKKMKTESQPWRKKNKV